MKLNLFSIDSRELKHISEKYGTPLYVFDEEGLLARFDEFNNAVKSIYSFSTIAISYKTNSLLGLLSRLHKKGAIAEVVSGDEIDIAQELGIYGKNIIFNGPVKTNKQLLHAFETGIKVNCDHFDEIKRAEFIAKKLDFKQNIGIRLTFSELTTMNRFGFNAVVDDKGSEAFRIIEWIKNSEYLELSGFHIHSATNIRDIKYFNQLSSYIVKFIRFVQYNFDIDLKWIDLGGGLAGILPVQNEEKVYELPSLKTYASEIIEPFSVFLSELDNNVELIFEPGRTLFEAFGGLLMNVIGKRKFESNSDIQEVIVDAGLSMIPLAETFTHPITTGNELNKPLRNYKLYGSSCRQKDVLRHKIQLPSIINSPLLMLGTGAYSMMHASDFINFKPGVLLRHSAYHYTWIRKPTSIEDKKRLETY